MAVSDADDRDGVPHLFDGGKRLLRVVFDEQQGDETEKAHAQGRRKQRRGEALTGELADRPERQGRGGEAERQSQAHRTGRRGSAASRGCLQLSRERIGTGSRTFWISDTRGIPESANV